jgi:hypothetical protein
MVKTGTKMLCQSSLARLANLFCVGRLLINVFLLEFTTGKRGLLVYDTVNENTGTVLRF